MNEQVEPIRVAIACQGGGSHTAFTAGVLSRLLQPDVMADHKIVALKRNLGRRDMRVARLVRPRRRGTGKGGISAARVLVR